MENLGVGRLYVGKCYFLVLRGIIGGFVVSIHHKENLSVTNINYLRTYNVKDKLRHLF